MALRWRDLAVDRRGLRDLLAVALLGRLALLGLAPLLSEDLWRYLWDGAAHWSGLNPYAHAPGAAAVDPLAATPALAAVRAQIGHAEIPTIYPPVAQLAFAAVGAVGPSQLLWRLALVAADGLSIFWLWRWAERTRRAPSCAALFAFAPVCVLEGAVGGHVDALGVAGLIVAGAALEGTRVWPAAVGLAVAVGTKLMPALVAPTLWLHGRRRALLGGVALLVLSALPYVGAGASALEGLSAYGHRWRGNEGAFAVIAWPFEQGWAPLEREVDVPPTAVRLTPELVGTPPGALPDRVWGNEVAFAAAKAVVILIFGAMCLWRLWRARDLEGFLGPVIATLMLVAPVVHPWYLVWLMPFAALALAGGRRWGAPLLLWSATAWLAYWPRPAYLATGQWEVPGWVPWAEYLPVWLGLGVVAVRAVQTRPPPSPGAV